VLVDEATSMRISRLSAASRTREMNTICAGCQLSARGLQSSQQRAYQHHQEKTLARSEHAVD
jgi:hypothetical protein